MFDIGISAKRWQIEQKFVLRGIVKSFLDFIDTTLSTNTGCRISPISREWAAEPQVYSPHISRVNPIVCGRCCLFDKPAFDSFALWPRKFNANAFFFGMTGKTGIAFHTATPISGLSCFIRDEIWSMLRSVLIQLHRTNNRVKYLQNVWVFNKISIWSMTMASEGKFKY